MTPNLIPAIVAALGLAPFGCSNSGDPSPPEATYPVCEAPTSCDPAVHFSQGDRGDLREFQRYVIVGASSDGHRLAVLYSHFGPSSSVSFVNVIIYEADAADFVYHLNLTGDPMGGAGTEEELQELETEVLAESATALASAGIVPGAHMPQALAWCQDGEAVLTDHCQLSELAWSVAPSACPGGGADPAMLWSMCPADAEAALPCAVQTTDPNADCQEGALALLDLYWYGDAMWVVAARATTPLQSLEFSIISVGGTVLPGASG
ncbi:MAG: hypothetical protein IPL79_18025 [Myxococcales bacterium]|nr:hypothetical protein [Myxococcales bacterium]